MTANTYILQLETATPVCSVAISKNGETITTVEADAFNLHASHLTLFIDQALEKAAITHKDIAAVAVSMGPGSYTGLRIGVSTAKGLCYALDIPLIAVNTLDAMVHGFVAGNAGDASAAVLVPMIDARRMEVYMAEYTHDFHCIAETEARIIDTDSFLITPDRHKYLLFGSGADKFETLFEGNDAVQVLTGFRNSASFFSRLVLEKFHHKTFEDVVYFEPYYLKDFMVTTPKKRR